MAPGCCAGRAGLCGCLSGRCSVLAFLSFASIAILLEVGLLDGWLWPSCPALPTAASAGPVGQLQEAAAQPRPNASGAPGSILQPQPPPGQSSCRSDYSPVPGKACASNVRDGFDHRGNDPAWTQHRTTSARVKQCAAWCAEHGDCVAFAIFYGNCGASGCPVRAQEGGPAWCHLCDQVKPDAAPNMKWVWYGTPIICGQENSRQASMELLVLRDQLRSAEKQLAESKAREAEVQKALSDRFEAQRAEGLDGAQWPAQGSFEAGIRAKIKIKGLPRYFPPRFPLPAIPVYADTERGCLIGASSCSKLNPTTTSGWEHDPHIRDIVASMLAPCLFQAAPCVAVDIGANFGYLSLSMLHFNTHVTSVEPQLDLCASLMESVLRNGFASRSKVRCGGVASSRDLSSGQKSSVALFNAIPNMYRYDGLVESPFDAQRYGLGGGLPLVPLGELMPPDNATTVHFLKVDTDSIDCDIVGSQLLPRLRRREWHVRSVCFESSGNCNMGPILHGFQELGYDVYRTHLWHVQFDGKGHFPNVLSHENPHNADEAFQLRFTRYLWRFHKMPLDRWQAAVADHPWQYFVTLEALTSNEMVITEKT